MVVPYVQGLRQHEADQILIYARRGCVFAFNFHPTESATNFFLHAHRTGEGEYKAIFSTDEANFGGQDRIDKKYVYSTVSDKRGLGFEIYLPCRSAVVFRKKRWQAQYLMIYFWGEYFFASGTIAQLVRA